VVLFITSICNFLSTQLAGALNDFMDVEPVQYLEWGLESSVRRLLVSKVVLSLIQLSARNLNARKMNPPTQPVNYREFPFSLNLILKTKVFGRTSSSLKTLRCDSFQNSQLDTRRCIFEDAAHECAKRQKYNYWVLRFGRAEAWCLVGIIIIFLRRR
jgi:hypothetical protein